MKHFMMDLETRGTIAGCSLVSIGIIGLDPFAKTLDDLFEDDGFYTVVSRQSCIDAMLHEERSTMEWWAKQGEEARKALHESDGVDAPSLTAALQGTIDYVAGHGTARNAKVWGNGADFDNPILNVAARMVAVTIPWQWGNRCYRTIKNLDELLGPQHKAPPVTRSGTYHNALDDAKTQAVHMWDIVSTLRDRVGA